MEIKRAWWNANKNTFDIKPIREFILKRIEGEVTIDPFANKNKIAKITNDLDTEYDTNYHMDAIEFLKNFKNESVDFILFDPPYSPRQVSESYKKLGKTVNRETTQTTYWSNLKKEIARVLKKDAGVISFGWNSGGIGKTLGFEIKEILIVAHGGWHNDTICTFERKMI
ncbi:DNA modification methylase [Fusobacterium sp. PH5-7]|uniref:hypothetical protein n=1 Tax=Fusobacterium sp. PH5-7 TaxID=2940528 RepID=UPI002475E244|nr:hypothetical protein [Fusobacterium sp. PH5-7]MDH6456951.1 DNA modification methylase [Fusobacterium sp. PH5-7]